MHCVALQPCGMTAVWLCSLGSMHVWGLCMFGVYAIADYICFSCLWLAASSIDSLEGCFVLIVDSSDELGGVNATHRFSEMFQTFC